MGLLPYRSIARGASLAYREAMTGSSDHSGEDRTSGEDYAASEDRTFSEHHTAARREVVLPVGVVVERRPSSHPWADETWAAVDVLPGADPATRWLEVAREGEAVRYHAATLPFTLHRGETEALVENLALDTPVIFAVLEPGEGAWPWEPHLVTASPFEAQDHEDSGDALVAKLPMPEPLAALVQAFVAEHHREVPFHKRKRDRVRVEDEKFGKVPIFARSERDL